MTDPFTELSAALSERIQIISDEESRSNEAAHMVRLQTISEKIERLEKDLPAGAHPQLRHYLQHRSYTKALQFLREQPRN